MRKAREGPLQFSTLEWSGEPDPYIWCYRPTQYNETGITLQFQELTGYGRAGDLNSVRSKPYRKTVIAKPEAPEPCFSPLAGRKIEAQLEPI